MDLTQAKQFLRAIEPIEALRKVAAFNSSRGPDEAPTIIKVILSGGHTLAGALLEVAGGGQALLVTGNGDVVYFHSSAMLAVQVVNPRRILSSLSDGRLFQPPTGKTPTTLALKRAFASAQEQLSSKSGMTLKGELFTGELTDRAGYNLSKFLEFLPVAFASISTDSEGVAALNEVDEVTIETSEQSRVRRNARELTFQLNLESDLGFFLENLQSAIEEQI